MKAWLRTLLGEKSIPAQLKYHLFDAFYLIYIISFLRAFSLASNRNGFLEVADISSFLFFIKISLSAALRERLCLKPTSSSNMERLKEETLRTYPKVVDFLLQTHGTNDVVA